jgi:hypothetical protein
MSTEMNLLIYLLCILIPLIIFRITRKKSYPFRVKKYGDKYIPEKNTPDCRGGMNIDFFQPMDENDGDYIPVTTAKDLSIYKFAEFDNKDECKDFIKKHWKVEDKKILIDI